MFAKAAATKKDSYIKRNNYKLMMWFISTALAWSIESLIFYDMGNFLTISYIVKIIQSIQNHTNHDVAEYL